MGFFYYIKIRLKEIDALKICFQIKKLRICSRICIEISLFFILNSWIFL